MRQFLILTASGQDRAGIVEQFTKLLLEYDSNVEASRMARLGGEFAMLMLISVPPERVAELQTTVLGLGGDEFEVQTRLTDPSKVPIEPGSTPCGITVLGADHIGIIHQVAQYLAEQGINVETMDTDVVSAPMSGSPLFTMSAVVRVPAAMSVDELRDSLEEIAEDLGVGAAVQPRTYTIEEE